MPPPSCARKAGLWGPASVRVYLSEGSDPRAMQALSLLRFHESSAAELDRLLRTHLRPLAPDQPAHRPPPALPRLPHPPLASKATPPPTQRAPSPKIDDPFEEEEEDSEEGEEDEVVEDGESTVGKAEADVTQNSPVPAGPLSLSRLATVPYVSSNNEARAWAELARLCAGALAAYPTTEAEDDAALSRDTGCLERFSNSWNARVQVRGEKRVLRFWHDTARDRSSAASDT